MIVVQKEAVYHLEQAAADSGVSLEKLMETAGTKVAALAAKLIAEKKLQKVCVLCGSGNNGGDGFVIARLLSLFCQVQVILTCGEPKTSLAKINLGILPDKVEVIYLDSRYYECIGIVKEAEMIIDAIYGIGFHGLLTPELADMIGFCNENQNAVKIAVDVPSGAACDTGAVENGCFHADYTVTFTTLKPVHVLYPSADFCGEVIVEDVGIPERVLKQGFFVMKTTDAYIEEMPLPEKPRSAHKGTNGTLLAVCGSYGMAGAAAMAAKAALRTGVGLVQLAVPETIYPTLASGLWEPVYLPLTALPGEIASKLLPVLETKATAGLIGCGLGNTDATREAVMQLIENSPKPLVIDADGINALAGHIHILKQAKAPLILTPHPAEMARLLGISPEAVQQSRYETACSFAQEQEVVLVLKGANTLIALPDGRVYVNLTGNNGMAKGGSGDVLSGMIASFLAQGFSPEASAVAGVYYHGLAGDRCKEKTSARAMLPTDMIEELKYLFSH